MAPARILVTGATGFLGGAVMRRLRAQGEDVLGLGRDRARRQSLDDEGLACVAADLAAADGFDALKGRRFDAIVHCAALSSAWGPRAAFERANVTATANLVAYARRAGVRRFVLVSSSSVYFRFRDQIGVREDMALPQPVNAYAWSKAAAERIVLAAPALQATVIRPRGLYGFGDSALLPRLLRAARRGPLPLFRGGRTRIDLTHVDDAVAAIAAVLAAPDRTSGAIYNVSGGVPLPIRTIVAEAARHAGQDVTWRSVPWPVAHAAIRANEVFHRLARPTVEPPVTAYAAGLFAFSQTLDVAAIARDAGWHPAVSFDEGLRRTFARGARDADHQ